MPIDLKPRIIKPAFGTVEVNWGHPLANGLRHAILLNEGGGPPKDIVTGAQGTPTAGATWGGNQEGICGKLAAATDNFNFGSAALSVGNQNSSVLFRGIVGATSIDRYAVMIGGTGTDEVEFGVNNSNAWEVLLPGVVDINFSVGPTVGHYCSAGFTYQRLVGATLDVHDITANVFSTASKAATNAPAQGSNSYVGGDGSSRSWRSSLNFAFIWARLLTPAEFCWLHAEPYAMFRPRTPVRFFKMPAAAALEDDGFQMALPKRDEDLVSVW